MRPRTDYATEIRITLASLVFTFVAWLMVTWETAGILWHRLEGGEAGGAPEQILFIVCIQVLIYGNFIYQFARLGYLRRRRVHCPLSPEERETLYAKTAPTLTILVPSYKEELAVVRRTLVSAALQDYPNRQVVLLLDDPPKSHDPGERAALAAMRQLPKELQRMLDAAAEPFEQARAAFAAREAAGRVCLRTEARTLAGLYGQAASWLETRAGAHPVLDHGDRLFVDAILGRAAWAHRERARSLWRTADSGDLSHSRIEREFARLAVLFRVNMTSFERKRYVNLSREPNKAMNLNSYIRLLGGCWREVRHHDGIHLHAAGADDCSLRIPGADFLITLDADSLLVSEYALVLVNEMLRPGNERLAVAQTPYNTVPNAPGLLERIAGATTDIQYLIHQGFTHFNATYWVGANALLRVNALQEIREVVRERGYEMPVFIQDRTVIEDTESSVDLVARGWTLYNYPDRLAFSATPPDFGSLLIQRRRWANGGLIILPKLLRYLTRRSNQSGGMSEAFFRVHYLASIAAVNVGLLILLGHGFEHCIDSLWLPLTALPYFFLYARDLRYSGYKLSDLPRVYALNLLLLPVNLGGVCKSLQQAVTGQRIPFGRTPKVSGRTAAPARYLVAEYMLLTSLVVLSGIDFATDRWLSGAFCLANALILSYAIRSFIGIRQSLADLSMSLMERWRRVPASSESGLASPLRALAAAPAGSTATAPYKNLESGNDLLWDNTDQSNAHIQVARRAMGSPAGPDKPRIKPDD